jgi:predicted TIM-barrel fold metal-dependent hydrolase
LSGSDFRRITIEEHYTDPELARMLGDARWDREIERRLFDMADLRIAEMDAAGVDLQILSHTEPGVQNFVPGLAVATVRGLNDRLDATVQRFPDRLAAFAALPTSSPDAAADEMQRCVEDLRFVGPMISGLSQGEFLDLPKYWPIFRRAAAMDVPIYIHPGTPHAAVTSVYYADYVERFPGILYAPLGYTVEASVQAVRLVLSGIFDELPDLKIVLGHLGEGLPFLLRRIDRTLRSADGQSARFREIFTRNFYVTTSGFFSDAALECSIAELGVDRILFAVDWPWGNNKIGVQWLHDAPITDEVRRKIFSGNAEALYKLPTQEPLTPDD